MSETPVDAPRIYRRALGVAGLDALGTLLLSLAGVLAVVLSGLHVDVWAVPLLAAVVAGEQLWRQRTDVPKEVPKLEIEPVELERGPLGPWVFLGFWMLVAAVLFGAGALVGSANVVLGFLTGLLLRDAVRVLLVAAWERRHGRRLVWRRDGERTQAAVLSRA